VDAPATRNLAADPAGAPDMEKEVVESLTASGPAGAAMLYLGYLIRGWTNSLKEEIRSLEDKLDGLGKSLHENELRSTDRLARLAKEVKSQGEKIASNGAPRAVPQVPSGQLGTTQT